MRFTPCPRPQVWASLLISVAVAFAFAVVAYFLSIVGLICFAGVGGLVLTAMPLRLFAPSLSPHLRVGLIGAGAAVGMLLTAFGVFKCRDTADEQEENGLVTQAPSVAQQRARSKLRVATYRKLLEVSEVGDLPMTPPPCAGKPACAGKRQLCWPPLLPRYSASRAHISPPPAPRRRPSPRQSARTRSSSASTSGGMRRRP